MMLTLTRREMREDGIFSELTDEKGKIIAKTLEHSYDCKPKLYDGEFTCVRGKHRLEGMTHDFETFEITGVSGHTNILWHTGNWNADSMGCVLLGAGIAQSSKGQMITGSKQTFADFLSLLQGIDSFQLVVQS
jgi:Family of unknown function (DUF5675)